MTSPGGFVPYLAPASWYAAWMSGGCAAGAVPVGAHPASCTLPGGVTLHVPIEGGRRALARLGGDALVSGHGRWQAVHMGALNALWSRTPYWEHLQPLLADAWADAVGAPLARLCARLHAAQCRLCGLPEALPSLLELSRRDPELWVGTRADTMSRLGPSASDPALPFLTRLLLLGPDAVFTL